MSGFLNALALMKPTVHKPKTPTNLAELQAHIAQLDITTTQETEGSPEQTAALQAIYTALMDTVLNRAAADDKSELFEIICYWAHARSKPDSPFINEVVKTAIQTNVMTIKKVNDLFARIPANVMPKGISDFLVAIKETPVINMPPVTEETSIDLRGDDDNEHQVVAQYSTPIQRAAAGLFAAYTPARSMKDAGKKRAHDGQIQLLEPPRAKSQMVTTYHAPPATQMVRPSSGITTMTLAEMKTMVFKVVDDRVKEGLKETIHKVSIMDSRTAILEANQAVTADNLAATAGILAQIQATMKTPPATGGGGGAVAAPFTGVAMGLSTEPGLYTVADFPALSTCKSRKALDSLISGDPLLQMVLGAQSMTDPKGPVSLFVQETKAKFEKQSLKNKTNKGVRPTVTMGETIATICNPVLDLSKFKPTNVKVETPGAADAPGGAPAPETEPSTDALDIADHVFRGDASSSDEEDAAAAAADAADAT